MRVSELMSRNVECITSDASLQEAANKMRSLNVGMLPVRGSGGVIGMLSDRDITVRATAEGDDPRAYTVKDAMTPEVVWCQEDDLVTTAAQTMQDKQIRRLLVLDENKRLVGIISLGDLAVRGGDEELTEATLERISEPAGADNASGY